MQKCPKCGSEIIQVQPDYEKLRSNYHCMSCGNEWSRAGINRKGQDTPERKNPFVIPALCMVAVLLMLILPFGMNRQANGAKESLSAVKRGSTNVASQTMAEPQADRSPDLSSQEYSADKTEAASIGVAAPDTGATTASPREFMVYFIDVGQGDASLVVCDGHAMLIDGGNSSESDKIYSFLQTRNISKLDYIVATHPDDDHVGGLSGALNYASAAMALSPVRDDDSESFRNFVKYLDRQGVSISVPAAGERFSLGSAEVTVVGPVKRASDDNNNSIVLKVTHGENSFLFTGDAETAEEADILQSGADIRCKVLKVAHHGSASSTSEEWLRAVQPEIAVISCGEGNVYGHLTERVLSLLKDEGVRLYRTDLHGYIKLYEEDGVLVRRPQKSPDTDVFAPGIIPVHELETFAAASETEEAPVRGGYAGGSDEAAVRGGNAGGSNEREYVANTNTKKFHYPGCDSVKKMKESNKWVLTCDRDYLIDRGYDPCKRCNP